MIRAALLIAQKDLRLRMRDRSAFLWGLLAPFGLAAIFSFVFNPISEAEFHAEYAVVDEDSGPIAQAFLEQLRSMEAEGVVTVTVAESRDEAVELVRAGSDNLSSGDEPQADAAFILPPNLSRQVLSGEGGSLTVIGARGSELAAQVAYSVAAGFGSELEAVDLAVRTALTLTQHGGDGPGEALEVAGLAEKAAQTASPITVADATASTRQLDDTTQMTAGMAVFFLFFTVQFGVTGLLEERRLGTMTRLLAAPLRRGSLVLGKALTSFALGVVSLAVLSVATTVLLGADWGHPLGVAVLIVAVVFAAMGILGIVAAAAKTQEQAGNFAAVIALVMGLLGGTFFPVAQVGGLLSLLSLATPHAWFIRGLGDLAGAGLSAIWPSVGALLAFGLVTGAGSWVFLRRSVAG
ncbi:MAG: hypothetical protein Kow00129_08360 [Thermoleophilia bacterium]